MRSMQVCCVLLPLYAGVALGGPLPYHELSITNHRNQTNDWLEMKFDHEDDQLWNFLVRQSKNSTALIISKENGMSGSKKCPPPGYERKFGLGYYKMYGKDSKTSWLKAEDQCMSDGGHLIVIDSEEEMMYMRIMGSEHAKNSLYFHVGIHDQYKEGDYVTVLNKTMESTRYSKWYSASPNGGTSENCVYFLYNTNTHKYGLDDESCITDKFGFICEIETL